MTYVEQLRQRLDDRADDETETFDLRFLYYVLAEVDALIEERNQLVVALDLNKRKAALLHQRWSDVRYDLDAERAKVAELEAALDKAVPEFAYQNVVELLRAFEEREAEAREILSRWDDFANGDDVLLDDGSDPLVEWTKKWLDG